MHRLRAAAARDYERRHASAVFLTVCSVAAEPPDHTRWQQVVADSTTDLRAVLTSGGASLTPVAAHVVHERDVVSQGADGPDRKAVVASERDVATLHYHLHIGSTRE
jgi:hypothetical protein